MVFSVCLRAVIAGIAPLVSSLGMHSTNAEPQYSLRRTVSFLKLSGDVTTMMWCVPEYTLEYSVIRISARLFLLQSASLVMILAGSPSKVNRHR